MKFDFKKLGGDVLDVAKGSARVAKDKIQEGAEKVKEVDWQEKGKELQGKAKELIEHTDAIRSDYHNFYSETNWGDSRAYDICINSSLLGLEGTAKVLTEFVKAALKIQ